MSDRLRLFPLDSYEIKFRPKYLIFFFIEIRYTVIILMIKLVHVQNVSIEFLFLQFFFFRNHHILYVMTYFIIIRIEVSNRTRRKEEKGSLYHYS